MSERDLFVVVADLDAENALKTLLCDRQRSFGIRLDFDPCQDLLRWKGRDSGCYGSAVELLRPPQNTHKHALLCFDRYGSGTEQKDRAGIEEELEQRLRASGWPPGASAVVVLDPELEAWVWADSPHVPDLLGWGRDPAALREYLQTEQLWPSSLPKPTDPKEAMSRALRKQRQPCVAQIFVRLARQVGLQGCQDPAFLKFRDTLTRWFPI